MQFLFTLALVFSIFMSMRAIGGGGVVPNRLQQRTLPLFVLKTRVGPNALNDHINYDEMLEMA